MKNPQNVLIILLLTLISERGYSQQNLSTSPSSEPEISAKEIAEEAEELRTASSRNVRRFHEVIDELLAEFGYDVKTGQMKGLQNLAVRRVTVSKALPKTYKQYTKLLVTERLRENSAIRIINCIPCFTKSSKLIEGQLIITSPATNVMELRRAADQLGIDNFLDIVLVYHTTHMVMGFQVFKSDTNEMIWARTYNSETIRSRYQKLAIDYSQIARSRPGEEYSPEYRLMLGLGGGGIPNIAGGQNDSSMVAIQARASEKFDNRRSEFGMIFSLYLTIASIASQYPTNESSTADGTNSAEPVDPFETPDTQTAEEIARPQAFSSLIGIYGMYAYNFLGAVESYNTVRNGLHIGLGGVLAAGYFAPAARAGWDIYFGRSFAASFSGNFIGSSQILVGERTIQTKGGAGADIVLSYNF